MATRIVVAYDFSSGADRALDWALAHVGPTGEGMTLLNVVPPRSLSAAALSTLPVVMGSGSETSPRDQAEADLRLLADERCPKARVDVVVGSDVGRMLVERCDEIDADLLVVGTRELGVVGRALLGSVGSYVVHHAHCPVVVVHTKGSGRGA